MSDDHPCNIEGIGTVRVKMIDGIVQELKEVRYVPQLKRNLISLGTLETLGLVSHLVCIFSIIIIYKNNCFLTKENTPWTY